MRHEVVLDDRVFVIDGPRDADERVREASGRGGSLPYWGLLWPMSRVLASWVRTSLLIGPGVRVLEVGCGLGLVGIAASSRGASVTMTDIDPIAVAWSVHNARLNDVDALCVVHDWRDDPDPAWSPGLVLASDVLYDGAARSGFARLLARLGCPGVVADPTRVASVGAEADFESAGLRCRVTPVTGGRMMMVTPS